MGNPWKRLFFVGTQPSLGFFAPCSWLSRRVRIKGGLLCTKLNLFLQMVGGVSICVANIHEERKTLDRNGLKMKRFQSWHC